MGMKALDLGIPMMFVTVFTIGLGGVFALIAWQNVFSEWRKTGRWSTSAAMHTFSAAVYLPLICYLLLASTSPLLQDRYLRNIPFAAIAQLSVLVTSFVLVIFSLVLLRWDSSRGRGAILTGSRALFGIDVLGFIGIAIGLRALLFP
jgi:hypothetical protein